MSIENKFLFIGKIFVVIFLIINSVNIFPIDFFNVFYYTNIFNVVLDTSTLLLLGLAIPRFLYIRGIQNYIKIKNKNLKNLDELNIRIDKYERNEKYNYRLTKLCALFFVFILISQPITLIFVLNRNDIYVNQTIESLSKSLDIQKEEILNIKESKPLNEADKYLKEEKTKEKEEIFNNMDKNYTRTIDNLIKENNLQKLNQIKFIIRNIFMSLVWAFAFFKLSNIHNRE